VTDEQFEQQQRVLIAIAGELAGIRVALMCAIDPPKVVPEKADATLPERCQGVHALACALQDNEAQLPRPSFADKHAWQCRGCRLSHTEITEPAS
jgi:hypothetical protein